MGFGHGNLYRVQQGDAQGRRCNEANSPALEGFRNDCLCFARYSQMLVLLDVRHCEAATMAVAFNGEAVRAIDRLALIEAAMLFTVASWQQSRINSAAVARIPVCPRRLRARILLRELRVNTSRRI
jgi:hypothetical protein